MSGAQGGLGKGYTPGGGVYNKYRGDEGVPGSKGRMGLNLGKPDSNYGNKGGAYGAPQAKPGY